MGKASERAEINDLVARASALSDLAKFELYEELRQQLAGVFTEEHPENRLIRERREALEYLGKAIRALGLGPRKVPTRAKFDQVAKEKEWPWDGARVIRVWERWRLATEAYLGTRKVETPAARRRRKHKRGPKEKTREKHLESLRTWLASEPELETRDAYNEFAEQYNASLPPDAVPLVRASTINRGLPLSWKNAIKVARGEMSLEEAVKVDLAEHLPVVHPEMLVGLPVISRVLDVSTQETTELARDDPGFPVSVAQVDGHRAWFYEDVKLYRRSLAFPQRREGEHQHAILGRTELSSILEVSERTIRRAIHKQNWSRVPQPEGVLGVGIPYWRREKVEAWAEHKQASDQAARERKQQEQEAKIARRERWKRSGKGRKPARDQQLPKGKPSRGQDRKRSKAKPAERATVDPKAQRKAAALGAALRGSNVRPQKRKRATK